MRWYTNQKRTKWDWMNSKRAENTGIKWMVVSEIVLDVNLTNVVKLVLVVSLDVVARRELIKRVGRSLWTSWLVGDFGIIGCFSPFAFRCQKHKSWKNNSLIPINPSSSFHLSINESLTHNNWQNKKTSFFDSENLNFLFENLELHFCHARQWFISDNFK